MTGSREKAVIVRCPYDVTLGCEPFRRGAEFTLYELLDMAIHWTIPSGTYWTYKGDTFLFYRGLRYTLLDGDVNELTAVEAACDEKTGYKLKWRVI